MSTTPEYPVPFNKNGNIYEITSRSNGAPYENLIALMEPFGELARLGLPWSHVDGVTRFAFRWLRVNRTPFVLLAWPRDCRRFYQTSCRTGWDSATSTGVETVLTSLYILYYWQLSRAQSRIERACHTPRVLVVLQKVTLENQITFVFHRLRLCNTSASASRYGNFKFGLRGRGTCLATEKKQSIRTAV